MVEIMTYITAALLVFAASIGVVFLGYAVVTLIREF